MGEACQLAELTDKPGLRDFSGLVSYQYFFLITTPVLVLGVSGLLWFGFFCLSLGPQSRAWIDKVLCQAGCKLVDLSVTGNCGGRQHHQL